MTELQGIQARAIETIAKALLKNMSKIKPKECQNVEYKRSWHDKYLEWVCGFANAQGGGDVLRRGRRTRGGGA